MPSPKIFGGTGNVVVIPPVTQESLDEALDKTKGMRLIGQRFIPDSYMFQKLVEPQAGNYKGDFNNLPFTSGSSALSRVAGPGAAEQVVQRRTSPVWPH